MPEANRFANYHVCYYFKIRHSVNNFFTAVYYQRRSPPADETYFLVDLQLQIVHFHFDNAITIPKASLLIILFVTDRFKLQGIMLLFVLMYQWKWIIGWNHLFRFYKINSTDVSYAVKVVASVGLECLITMRVFLKYFLLGPRVD